MTKSRYENKICKMELKFVRSLTKTMFEVFVKTMFEVFVCSCVLLDMGLLPPTAFSTKD